MNRVLSWIRLGGEIGAGSSGKVLQANGPTPLRTAPHPTPLPCSTPTPTLIQPPNPNATPNTYTHSAHLHSQHPHFHANLCPHPYPHPTPNQAESRGGEEDRDYGSSPHLGGEGEQAVVEDGQLAVKMVRHASSAVSGDQERLAMWEMHVLQQLNHPHIVRVSNPGLLQLSTAAAAASTTHNPPPPQKHPPQTTRPTPSATCLQPPATTHPPSAMRPTHLHT